MGTFPYPFSRRDAVQAMPVVAMVLVVFLLGVMLWLLRRNEIEDEAQELIKDILWVEQDLNFHLTSDEEKLSQMAVALGLPAKIGPSFAVQARQIITNNPEIERIIWRDASGAPRATQPPMDDLASLGDGAAPSPWSDAFLFAHKVGKRAYTGPLPLRSGETGFELHMPVFQDSRFAGMVVGQFSLAALLNQQVPWWFTEKYQLAIVDGAGTVLGAKSHLPTADPGPSHQVAFDPPGHDLALVATVHRSRTNMVRNLLSAAIFGLSAAAVTSLWAMRRHIRRRVVAEQALRAEHAFRKAMEDSLTVGLRARDLTGRITYVNPSFCRMVGFSAEALVGAEPPMPYWVPEDMEKTMVLHQQVLDGKAPPEGFEITFRRHDGQCFDALVYEAPLIDAHGTHTGWMGSVLDITERKHAEDMARQQQERLQRTSRLITMGEMASTLAHELNQPLSAIASYATGCLNRIGAGDVTPAELHAPLTKLGHQAQRAGQIIRRVSDFVKKREPVLAACPIAGVVENVADMMEPEARKRGIHIECLVPDTAICVLADSILVEQVLLNLVRNGMEAMSHTAAADRVVTIAVAPHDGVVLLRVSDRGAGVASAVAAQLFTPFFTTKDDGMGMGLNICRSIAEYHQGRLWFEANAGGGASFLFTLPVAPSCQPT